MLKWSCKVSLIDVLKEKMIIFVVMEYEGFFSFPI